jgi:hypothetical protein
MARRKGWLPMDDEAIQRRIVELQVEHRDLNDVIARVAALVGHDELQLRRLKKKKLQIKDQILQLQIRLVPDIPA